MNQKNRLAGRFLPSRVYARWKWTVRFGLSAVPLILFLAGSVVVYLQPSRYQSTAVFNYRGERPVAEVIELLKSRNLFDRAFDEGHMTEKLEMSKSTAYDHLHKLIKTRVDPTSGTIEVKVTLTRKEIARDLAAGLPKALQTYETEWFQSKAENLISVAASAATDAEDEAASKRNSLATLILVRGEAPAEPAARVDVDAARAEVEIAAKRVTESEAKLQKAKDESKIHSAWVEVLSEPRIADTPVVTDSDETMGAVILRSLGTGLGCALVIPYLLELLFPRSRKTKKPQRSAKYEEPVLASITAGG